MSKWVLLFLITIVIEVGLFVNILHNQKQNLRKGLPEAEDDETEFSWAASDHPPMVIPAILGVFAAFFVIALLVAKHATTYRDLLLACVTACLGSGLGMITKSQFRLTHQGIRKIHYSSNVARNVLLFTWDQLERIEPNRHGFTYHLNPERVTETDKRGKKTLKGLVPVGANKDTVIAMVNAKLGG